MKNPLIIIGAGAAIAFVGLAAWPGNQAGAAPSGPVVLIDGQDQGIESMKVYCTTIPATNGFGGVGQLDNISIGNTGGVELTQDNPPQVQQFSFAKQPYSLQYKRNTRSDTNAVAIKSGKSYKITGTAAGFNRQTEVIKPFEVDVTCP